MTIRSFRLNHIQTFLLGLLALLPLVLTVAAVGWAARLLEQFFGPASTIGEALTLLGLSFVESRLLAYVCGLILVLAIIYVLGVLLQRRIAQRVQDFVNGLFRRIPFVGRIYDFANRLVAVLGSKDDAALKKMKPAWCYFGGDGGAAVLGLLPDREPVELNGTEYLSILVPSAPVPFGGGLLFVPKEWVVPADIGVEGLTSIYMTMGVSTRSTLAAEPNGTQ